MAALRKRDLHPYPLASEEDAKRFSIATTRTTAGYAVWQATENFDVVHRRVDVRIESVRVDPYGVATGIVLTRLDGGPWVNEGAYILDKKENI